MPSIRVLKLLNQLGGGGWTQLRFEVALSQRFVRNDPVDPSQSIAAPKIHVLFDSLGDGLRRLDKFPGHIDDVEIAVRGVGEVAGTKPNVGGSQKFPVLLFRSATGNEAGSLETKQIAMDQIPTDISGKQVIAVLLWEGITRIDRSSRCSRKVTSHNLSGGIQFTHGLQAIFPVTL